MDVEEHTIELDGAPVFLRRAPPAGVETLYLHSVPTSCDDWGEPLARTGGVAVDLPGFGRTGKAGNLDYSLGGYVTFAERLLEHLGLEQVSVVGHGWGAAVALLLAGRAADRVARVAIVDALPLLDGFAWPPLARWLRRPGVGELLMGSVNRWLLARVLRGACADPGAWPAERVNAIWEQFDQGTQRAILRLHRSVDIDSLPVIGAGLRQLSQPVLVVWGELDPWFPASFAGAYARALPDAELELCEGAGHWPWLERPHLAERLAHFATTGE
ncbi:MAG TPA: alpha/beta hydrolase [Solirubrobacteraceae bacterium]|nr:alpha/beta hydrolase [Solirubrobacteraceae bacterium]